jgi:hypothetical protein
MLGGDVSSAWRVAVRNQAEYYQAFYAPACNLSTTNFCGHLSCTATLSILSHFCSPSMYPVASDQDHR